MLRYSCREKKKIKFRLLDKEIINKKNHDFSRRSPYTLLSSLLFLYRAPFGRISVLTRLARSGIINRSLSLFLFLARVFPLRIEVFRSLVYHALISHCPSKRASFPFSLSPLSLFSSSSIIFSLFYSCPFSSRPLDAFRRTVSWLWTRTLLPHCSPIASDMPLFSSYPSANSFLSPGFSNLSLFSARFALFPFALPYPPSSICLPRAILRATVERPHRVTRSVSLATWFILLATFFNIPSASSAVV